MGNCTSSKYNGMATSVPQVPGANGDNPEPNPNDSKCRGLRSSRGEIGEICELGKMAETSHSSKIDLLGAGLQDES